jgi:hypothetical protein
MKVILVSVFSGNLWLYDLLIYKNSNSNAVPWVNHMEVMNSHGVFVRGGTHGLAFQGVAFHQAVGTA